jgi:hypothetical protein
MYSPKINKEYIPLLYKLSKEAGLPMTIYVNQIIGQALMKEGSDDKDGTDPLGAEALSSQKNRR